MLQIRMFAQFDVRVDGKRIVIPARAAQSLFAYLVLNPGIAHRREKLAGMLWPEVSEESARHHLRHELWRLRKALALPQSKPEEYLLAEDFSISFNAAAECWLDVAQLMRQASDSGTGELIAQVALYRGELLPGFYDDWVMFERERAHIAFERKMQALVEKLIAQQEWTLVLEWAERWIALGETPEPAYRALMVAHGAAGESSQVVLAYERCVEALRNKVGVEPSAETRTLYEQLARGEPMTRATVVPLPPILVQPSGTVTFLFTDIEGSTLLLERLGNDYATLLADQRNLLRECAEKFNGHKIDTQGDAFFFAFFRAADAVAFAADAQRALAAHPWPGSVSVRARMGLHTGEPMLARTGYVGMDVHRAARIGAAGHGGQVLVSRETRDLVENDLPPGTHLKDLGEHKLQDLHYPVHIIQLTVEELGEEFPPLKAAQTGVEPPAPGDPPFKGLQYFDESDAALFFGREPLVSKLIADLNESRFLAVVVGASGSGKSSVVRAGIIPALKRGGPLADGTLPPDDSRDWRIFVLTPTAHPLEALATAMTRESESVTATATLLDDLSRDPRALHLCLRRRTNDERRIADIHTMTSVSGHTLIVIDQFEELFTLCRDDVERETFIDNLLTAITPYADPDAPDKAREPSDVTLILTLRADFYAHLADYPELREAVAHGQEYIGPMTNEELRRAIEEPAKQGGWELEPGLVDLMLRDAGDEPGALPLLSHALLETWKRRSGHVMTLKGYADSGGVRGAIAHTAETTFEQLTPEQQQIARGIFLRLTELGEATEDTRRRASYAELVPVGKQGIETRAVLTQLADARLITTSENTAEVAHEALIREWPRLREWLNTDREGLRLHRQLTEAAQEWELLERDPGALYRGARLAVALEFASQAKLGTNADPLNAHELAFLNASQEQGEREAKERAEQQQRELDSAKRIADTAQTLAAEQQARAEESDRSNKRLRRRAIFLAGVFLLALLLAGTALFLGDQSNRNAAAAQQNAAQAETNANAAETARLNAEREKRAATARELAASAVSTLEGDPERSILLALQAIKATAQDQIVLPEAETALHRAVLGSRIEHTLRGHADEVWFVTYSPDGKYLATNSGDGTVRVWDVGSGAQVREFEITPGFIGNLSYGLDGTRLATVDTAGQSSEAKIWDVNTGELVRHFDLGIPGDKWNLNAYNRDLSKLVVTSLDGKATIYDVASGMPIRTLSNSIGAYCSVTFSHDDTRIVTGCEDGHAKVWDAETGQELLDLCCHTLPIAYATFNPEGTRIGTAGEDHTAKVWDASTGEELFTLTGHTDALRSITYSQDGKRIATGSGDQRAKVWDAENGSELMTFGGHTSFASIVTFSPDGTRLATTSADGTAKIWDMTPNREGLAIPTGILTSLDVEVGTVVYSPDGTRLATGLENGTVGVWDAHSGEMILTLRGHSGPVHGVAYSKDGTRIISASSDKTAKVWDAQTGEEIVTLKGHVGTVLSVALNSNGTRAASGSLGPPDAAAKVWDTQTGEELMSFPLPSWVFSVQFSPDEKYLAATHGSGGVPPGYADGYVHVWDLESRRSLLVPGDEFDIWAADYSPDGTRLAIGGRNFTPKVLDALTGKELLSLHGLTSFPLDIAYSPDGTRIATPNEDGTVKVWDAASGGELFTIADQVTGAPHSVAFSPDGTRLAFADLNSIRVYLTRIEDLVELAKTHVTRSLTPEECRTYLHVEPCPP